MSQLVARRVVDFFRPGDVVPAGHYPADTLKRFIEKGLVVEVDDTPDALIEQAAEQPPAPRRIARKGRTGQL